MTKDSEQIREEIRVTRSELSTDVNALADSVKPGNVAKRQVSKVREAATSTRERVMGVAPDLGSAKESASAKAGGAVSSVSDAASSATDAVASSPEVIRARTQGNPLAAGLIAFGAGWLVASLIPSTRREQEAALKAKESAAPLAQEVSGVAKQAAENLREPAQDAVASVKQTAAEAVENTKQEGTAAAQSVKSDTQNAASAVQESRR
jgi:gas vesicle protein